LIELLVNIKGLTVKLYYHEVTFLINKYKLQTELLTWWGFIWIQNWFLSFYLT